jgi:hypothetical protein
MAVVLPERRLVRFVHESFRLFLEEGASFYEKCAVICRPDDVFSTCKILIAKTKRARKLRAAT